MTARRPLFAVRSSTRRCDGAIPSSPTADCCTAPDRSAACRRRYNDSHAAWPPHSPQLQLCRENAGQPTPETRGAGRTGGEGTMGSRVVCSVGRGGRLIAVLMAAKWRSGRCRNRRGRHRTREPHSSSWTTDQPALRFSHSGNLTVDDITPHSTPQHNRTG